MATPPVSKRRKTSLDDTDEEHVWDIPAQQKSSQALLYAVPPPYLLPFLPPLTMDPALAAGLYGFPPMMAVPPKASVMHPSMVMSLSDSSSIATRHRKKESHATNEETKHENEEQVAADSFEQCKTPPKQNLDIIVASNGNRLVEDTQLIGNNRLRVLLSYVLQKDELDDYELSRVALELVYTVQFHWKGRFYLDEQELEEDDAYECVLELLGQKDYANFCLFPNSSQEKKPACVTAAKQVRFCNVPPESPPAATKQKSAVFQPAGFDEKRLAQLRGSAVQNLVKKNQRQRDQANLAAFSRLARSAPAAKENSASGAPLYMPPCFDKDQFTKLQGFAVHDLKHQDSYLHQVEHNFVAKRSAKSASTVAATGNSASSAPFSQPPGINKKQVTNQHGSTVHNFNNQDSYLDQVGNNMVANRSFKLASTAAATGNSASSAPFSQPPGFNKQKVTNQQGFVGHNFKNQDSYLNQVGNNMVANGSFKLASTAAATGNGASSAPVSLPPGFDKQQVTNQQGFTGHNFKNQDSYLGQVGNNMIAKRPFKLASTAAATGNSASSAPVSLPPGFDKDQVTNQQGFAVHNFKNQDSYLNQVGNNMVANGSFKLGSTSAATGNSASSAPVSLPPGFDKKQDTNQQRFAGHNFKNQDSYLNQVGNNMVANGSFKLASTAAATGNGASSAPVSQPPGFDKNQLKNPRMATMLAPQLNRDEVQQTNLAKSASIVAANGMPLFQQPTFAQLYHEQKLQRTLLNQVPPNHLSRHQAPLLFQPAVIKKEFNAMEALCSLVNKTGAHAKRDATETEPRGMRLPEPQEQHEEEKEQCSRLKPEEAWNLMFGRLWQYKQKFGDCLVPYKWEEDVKLSDWVSGQRKYYKRGSLAKDRIEKLDSIGFVWSLRRPQPWDSMFRRLLGFKIQHGHVSVPQRYEADPKLARWVVDQRNRLRKGRLTKQKVQKLESIGFISDAWVQTSETS